MARTGVVLARFNPVDNTASSCGNFVDDPFEVEVDPGRGDEVYGVAVLLDWDFDTMVCGTCGVWNRVYGDGYYCVVDGVVCEFVDLMR